eukprot:symbB.v1.2.030482.t1/scaffold3434.1/size111337/7
MCMWMFLKQMVDDDGDFPFRLVFKNIKRRKVYGLPASSVITTYVDLSTRFVATVLFPHDIGIISFDDLYAMGIPIFLPEQELVENIAYAHLVSSNNYPWYLLREEHSTLHYPAVFGTLPWDPGWNWWSCGGLTNLPILGSNFRVYWTCR